MFYPGFSASAKLNIFASLLRYRLAWKWFRFKGQVKRDMNWFYPLSNNITSLKLRQVSSTKYCPWIFCPLLPCSAICKVSLTSKFFSVQDQKSHNPLIHVHLLWTMPSDLLVSVNTLFWNLLNISEWFMCFNSSLLSKITNNLKIIYTCSIHTQKRSFFTIFYFAFWYNYKNKRTIIKINCLKLVIYPFTLTFFSFHSVAVFFSCCLLNTFIIDTYIWSNYKSTL